jgi:hypothetical protein
MSRSRQPQNTAESRTKGHGSKTEATRERAIVALLSEPTIGKAAALAGIGERTLRTWLTEDPAFKAAYDAARRATFEAAMSRVATLTVKAVETLDTLITDTETPAAVKLGAARTIAEIGMHQHDADTILRKLEEIEAAQQGRR